MGGMPYSPPYSPGRASTSGRRVSLSDTPLEGTLRPYIWVPCICVSARISVRAQHYSTPDIGAVLFCGTLLLLPVLPVLSQPVQDTR